MLYLQDTFISMSALCWMGMSHLAARMASANDMTTEDAWPTPPSMAATRPLLLTDVEDEGVEVSEPVSTCAVGAAAGISTLSMRARI